MMTAEEMNDLDRKIGRMVDRAEYLRTINRAQAGALLLLRAEVYERELQQARAALAKVEG